MHIISFEILSAEKNLFSNFQLKDMDIWENLMETMYRSRFELLGRATNIHYSRQ